MVASKMEHEVTPEGGAAGSSPAGSTHDARLAGGGGRSAKPSVDGFESHVRLDQPAAQRERRLSGKQQGAGSGAAQLGTLFTDGSQQNSLTPILLGLIMIIVLALLFDGVILAVMRLLTPWQRAARS